MIRIFLLLALIPSLFAQEVKHSEKPKLLLFVTKSSNPNKDLASMTLAGMCEKSGVLFDSYQASEHLEGGLFAPHGSTVIGGAHSLRIARALATFETTVVRMDDVLLFDSLFRTGAKQIIDAKGDLPGLYAEVAKTLGLEIPKTVTLFDTSEKNLCEAAYWPEVVNRGALAYPLDSSAEMISAIRKSGVMKAFTIARGENGQQPWKDAGIELEESIDLAVADPERTLVERWLKNAPEVDLLEPNLASFMLPFSIREKRLMLTYANLRDFKQAEKRRDLMLELTQGNSQTVVYGRWFGDAAMLPLAARGMALSVVEPNRHILTVFEGKNATLPQPKQSCFDLEPSDAVLREWAKQGVILSTWVLHSGEPSHNDSVMNFYDWSSMTGVKIGSGVHWQRYAFDPDVVEPLQVPVDQGGVLGLVEPVLHSTGAGVNWETGGTTEAMVGLMKKSRDKIASYAGVNAPRGVYFFGDLHQQSKDSKEPGPAQIALWKAVKEAGFSYAVTSILEGESRIIYQDGDFVVLTQTAITHNGSPFIRGDKDVYSKAEKILADQNKPGWLIGAIDTPIHGSLIYQGRPYKNKAPRLNEFFDYIQKGGITGKIKSATPHTIARYARILQETKP
ncbi:MAG: hypothetical protein H8M99_08900 [Gloeobacteraceae cyanobacterium ES-bin-144]|nr:hypothetical protein [Verrucomicrobiales bacterium]